MRSYTVTFTIAILACASVAAARPAHLRYEGTADTVRLSCVPAAWSVFDAAPSCAAENASSPIPGAAVAAREKFIATQKICWLPFRHALYAAVDPSKCGGTEVIDMRA